MNSSFRLGASVACLLAVFALSKNALSATQHISACGATIHTSGLVVVDSDLTCSGDAIDVVVSNVTLKLQGHTLTGPGGNGTPGGASGVLISSTSSSVALRNVVVLGPGTITNFNQGIAFLGVVGGGAVGITLNINPFAGLVMNGNGTVLSQSLQISQNTLTSNGQGLTANGLTASTIVGNNANQNVIDLFFVTKSMILGNTSNNNSGGNGLQLGGRGSLPSTGNTLEGNQTIGNTVGINILAGASANHFSGNVAVANSTDINDTNTNCDSDTYKNDVFAVANQACVK